MDTINGVLRGVGDCTMARKLNTYSYIEVGDTTTGKLCIFDGLDGKMRNSLGEFVEIYTASVLFSGTYIYAITVGGKSYYAKSGNFIISFIFLIVLTLVLFWTIVVPILFGYEALKQYRFYSLQKRGRQLPNSVGLTVP